MKKIVFLLFLSCCTVNNDQKMSQYNEIDKNPLKLSISEYKKSLVYYNDNNNFPNIDK